MKVAALQVDLAGFKGSSGGPACANASFLGLGQRPLLLPLRSRRRAIRCFFAGPTSEIVPPRPGPRSLTGIDQRIREMLLTKMFAHLLHDPVPEIVAALLMDPGVADDSEFLGAGRDKDEHGVAMLRPVHLELEKLLLREREGIALISPRWR